MNKTVQNKIVAMENKNKVEINLEGGIFKVWFNQQNNANRPVGVIAHEATRRALMISARPESIEVLKEVFGAAGVNKEYKGLPEENVVAGKVKYVKTSVSINLARKVKTELENINFDAITEETRVRIIRDINAIGDMDVQRTIDSSKDGSKVEVLFFFGTFYQPLGLVEATTEPLFTEADIKGGLDKTQADTRYRLEGNIVTNFYKGDSFHDENGKFFVNDVVNKVKLRGHDIQMKGLEVALNHHEEMKLSDELVAKFTELQGKYNDQFDMLVELKLIYNNLVAAHQEKIQSIRNQFDNKKISQDTMDSMMKSESDKHRSRMNQLGVTARTLTASMSHTDRGNLAKAASGFSKYSEDVTALGNSYAATVLPEETILSATDIVEDAIDFLGYPIIGSAKELEKANLQAGDTVEVSGGRLLPDRKLMLGKGCPDGTHTVHEYKGRLYAGTKVSELINPEVSEEIQHAVVRLHISETKGGKADGELSDNLKTIREQLTKAEHCIITANGFHGSYVWGFIEDKYVRIARLSFDYPGGLYANAIDMKKVDVSEVVFAIQGKYVNVAIFTNVLGTSVEVLPSEKDYGQESLYDEKEIAEEADEEVEEISLVDKVMKQDRRRKVAEIVQFEEEDEDEEEFDMDSIYEEDEDEEEDLEEIYA
jgi:hypothetical protein